MYAQFRVYFELGFAFDEHKIEQIHFKEKRRTLL